MKQRNAVPRRNATTCARRRCRRSNPPPPPPSSAVQARRLAAPEVPGPENLARYYTVRWMEACAVCFCAVAVVVSDSDDATVPGFALRQAAQSRSRMALPSGK